MKQSIRHEIPISADRFWSDLFFCPDYTRSLHLEGLQCLEYRMIEDTGAPLHKRVLFNIPPIKIPKSLQKLVKDSLGYTEKGEFDPHSQCYRFVLEPTLLPQKISISGFYHIESLDNGYTARTCELDFHVKVFGLGGAMERVIAQSNIDIQQKSADFCKRWIEQRGLG